MKAKLLITLLLVGVAVVVLADPPLTMEVGNSSVKILPSRIRRSAPAWTNEMIMGQGDVVQNGNIMYMAFTAGTTTNEPDHGTGLNTTDDDVEWLHVVRGLRNGFTCINASSNALYLSVGAPAEEGKGILLTTYGSSFGHDSATYQEAIHAIGTLEQDTDTICYIEW